MLIHLTPTFLNKYKNVKVSLESLTINVNDNSNYEIPVEDLTLKKPYPNKSYYVACIKRRNKAFVGLLAHIEEKNINEFTVCEEWKTSCDNVEKKHFHYITFNLLDNDSSIVSQDFLLWQPYSSNIHKGWIPVNCTPIMEFDTNCLKRGVRYSDVQDGFYFDGILKQRSEKYYVPTMPHNELLERGNLLYSNRMPDINDGFNLTHDYE